MLQVGPGVGIHLLFQFIHLPLRKGFAQGLFFVSRIEIELAQKNLWIANVVLGLLVFGYRQANDFLGIPHAVAAGPGEQEANVCLPWLPVAINAAVALLQGLNDQGRSKMHPRLQVPGPGPDVFSRSAGLPGGR
ncbi:MAG: hypothetical protein F4X84_06925 [Synechococcus sp. SB0662_bin_45]|nr:hypothetical protein [Synechococcus sp. SB0668_bin_13]MYE22067.1 hypothetical protein [Synechococcus sp. SB0662_bin_45]